MLYSYNKVLELAEEIGNGWQRTEIELSAGDVACDPSSTKWAFAGQGKIRYLIHPSGITTSVSKGIYRTLNSEGI